MLALSSSSTFRSPLLRRLRRFCPILLGFLLVGGLASFTFFLIMNSSKSKRAAKIVNPRENYPPIENLPRHLSDKPMIKNYTDQINLDNPSEPVIISIDLRRMPRPISIIRPPPKNRIDYKKLATRSLKEASILKENGFTFRVIVFAWRRLASLKRLIDSLLQSEYHGFTVHLDVHMDGEAHPKVVKYIEDLIWTFGSFRVHRHAERVGLEKAIMNGWQPIKDTEFAFFFEDDIEVSHKYFEYSIICLQKYLFPAGKPASPTIWKEKLLGISLHTPRYNEVLLHGKDWIPSMAMAESDSQFLFQLPSSWGALYTPWHWRSFLEYYNWRSNHITGGLQNSIPDSATNRWVRSWKKYLSELMIMKGYVLIFCNLPNQISLSTHHREPGEHTSRNAEETLVEDLGRIIIDSYTVPLVKECDYNQFYKMIAEMKPLRELPVLNFHHERVESIYNLMDIGTFTVDLMEKSGLPESVSSSDPASNCILDRISFPLRMREEEALTEKFLIYEPGSSLKNQISALKNAVFYSMLLKRTLVVPPIISSKNISIQTAWNSLFQIEVAGLPIKHISLPEFMEKHGGDIERSVKILDWKARSLPESTLTDLGLFNELGIIPSHQSMLYWFNGQETEIVKRFSSCVDPVLAIRRIDRSFAGIIDKALENKTSNFLDSGFSLSDDVLASGLKNMSTNQGCVVFSRGDPDRSCGEDISRLKSPTQEQAISVFRNCRATLDKTIQYFLKDAQSLLINLGGIYVINETPETDIPAKVYFNGKTYKVYTINDIIKNLQQNPRINPIPIDIITGIAQMVELSICKKTTFFLGNVYSSLSLEISKERKVNNLPFNNLGRNITMVTIGGRIKK